MPDHASLLRQFMERVWNRGELDAIDELLAETYTVHSDPGDPWSGQSLDRAGFRARLVASRAPFPDLRFDLGEVVAEGDRVAVSWTMRGTHSEAMGDVPATGNAIEVDGMTIYHFEAERIAGHTQVVDRLAVLQQLGLLALGGGG
jgi:steroid delta-isomerase-like uncharacterized protein